jgi:hypothetical protein
MSYLQLKQPDCDTRDLYKLHCINIAKVIAGAIRAEDAAHRVNLYLIATNAPTEEIYAGPKLPD